MSRGLKYPVVYAIEYASGRVVNGICTKNWDELHKDIALANTLGTVKAFRYSTACDRQMRGQRINSKGAVEQIPTLIRHTELSAKHPPKWRKAR